MVAVESGSMEPHMYRGDLVFVMEESRLSPSYAEAASGVVSYRVGETHGYSKFGASGDVIVYLPNGADTTPIIHRAMFWVNESENWYDKADPSHVSGSSCDVIPNCPAPHAGFITKGDANGRYDQASGIAEPVRPEWITGIARVRIPYLGWIRLGLADTVHRVPVIRHILLTTPNLPLTGPARRLSAGRQVAVE
jgi:signal peptidase